MTVQEAIETIEALYPAECPFPNTEAIGQELLKRAERETGYYDNWRNRPEKTLLRYAELCEMMERESELKFNQQYPH